MEPSLTLTLSRRERGRSFPLAIIVASGKYPLSLRERVRVRERLHIFAIIYKIVHKNEK